MVSIRRYDRTSDSTEPVELRDLELGNSPTACMANDDGSERRIRRTKENVLATSQLERTVTYDMRGRVRATSEAAPGPSGVYDFAVLSTP